MLMATWDKYDEEIDVAQRLTDDGNQKESSGKIAALFGQSVFHSSGNVEEDRLKTDELCVHFGDNLSQEVEKTLDEQIKEDGGNALSKVG